MKKFISLFMCIVMTLCTVLCFSTSVTAKDLTERKTDSQKLTDAEDFPDEWEGFQCKKDDTGHTLTLRRYKGLTTSTGAAVSVDIPAKTTIKGAEYTVKLNDNCNQFFCGHWYPDVKGLKSIKFSHEIDTSNVTNMSEMFYQCESLEELDIGGFKTNNVVYMNHMFYMCKSLKSLDVTHFNTSKVVTMEAMFLGLKSATSLKVSSSSFDTSNVTDMTYMFDQCESLESLDLSNFNTSRVSYMNDMFMGCKKLKTLDLSKFNTPMLYQMYEMFRQCESLESVNLSSFDTSRVKWMWGMFAECYSLKTLDLSGFDLGGLAGGPDVSVTGYKNILRNCNSLVKIEIPKNLKYESELPGTFARETDKTDIYTYLPTNQETSFTIVKYGGTPVTGITITPTEQSISIGSTFTIVPKVLPEDATNKSVTYESSDTSVATVDSLGVVTGVATGEAVITATTADGGFTANCKVTVGKEAPTYTAPKAVNVTYTGSPQNMAVAGSVTGGIMYYALGSSAEVSPGDAAWSTDIPKATEAGNYYVWYKIMGDEDHGNISPTYIGTPSVINPQSKNVIEINERAGTALVYDDTAGRNVIVPIARIKKGEVYRFYDRNRGEHFYTQDEKEKETLERLGWQWEASDDFYSVEAVDADALPVYRLYNPNGGGMHFFTTDSKGAVDLRRQGWSYEGIAFYVYKSTSLKGTDQYRLYNPYSPSGEHVWTSDETGRDYLKKIGWRYEGIAWRVL